MKKFVYLIAAAAAILCLVVAKSGFDFFPSGWDSPPPTNQATLMQVALVTVLALNVLPLCSRKLGLTLTSPQVLLDVIGAFRKAFPAITLFGAQWKGTTLKLNQKYVAQIAVYGSASTYDRTQGGYKNGANTARNGLVDVSVVVNNQPTYPLLWQHIDGIKDDKNQYAKVIAGGGYTLGKSAIDNGFFAKMTTRYFSQENVTAAANTDWDWLNTLTTTMNQRGCEPVGRVLFVNSTVAGNLASDPRLISRDYFNNTITGQLLTGQGYRMWTNVAGFALIQEYPDLPSNNGTALTGVSATAATDVLAKNAHGLVTGDPVVISAIGGGAAGLAITTRYWTIKVDANSFKLATTRANALAGTAIDITSDSSGGGLTLALTENLIAFAADGRAFASLAGVPDGLTVMADQIGVPQTMAFDVIQEENSKITMAAAKWQETGTADVYWVPTFVYGTNAGRECDTAVAANTLAANSALASANTDGTGTDYAGLRITSGAS